MKRIVSLVAFVMLSVFAVMCFLPIMFKESFYKAGNDPLNAIYTHNSSSDKLRSLFKVDASGISYIVLTLIAIGIVVLILQFAGKRSSILNILSFTPVLAFCLFIVTILIRININDPDDWHLIELQGFYSEFSLGWGTIIGIAIILAVSVMSFLIAIRKIDD